MPGKRWTPARPAVIGAAAVVITVTSATAAGAWWLGRSSHGSHLGTATTGVAAAGASVGGPQDELSPIAQSPPTPTSPTPNSTVQPTAGPTSSPSSQANPTPTGTALASPTPNPPEHFGTLAPGSQLPSSAQCSTWVHARPIAENKGVNRVYNQATGHRLAADFFPSADDPRANTQIAPRVDGAFTGTTHEVLRWAACKWGIDEDLVYAQAAKESWWRQTTRGDWGSDANNCAPDNGLGAGGRPGQCPESFGILQNRYPYERSSWPGIDRSTAMNADTAYAIWRSCYEGYDRWLNDVERGSQYGAGDAWGCIGRWFSGRWHTAPAEQYIAAVQDYQRQRIWEHSDFQE